MNEDVSRWILLFSVSVEEEMWAAGVIAKVQCSLRANQTRPPEQHLTFPINTSSRLSLSPSSPGLSQTLSSQPDCLLHSVDTGRLLRQSLASLTPVRLSSLLQSYMHVPSHMHTCIHPLSQSFPLGGSRVFVSLHILTCFDVLLLVWITTAAGFTFYLCYPVIRWIDFGVCWQDKRVVVVSFPCLFGLKFNRYITFHFHRDKEPYKRY